MKSDYRKQWDALLDKAAKKGISMYNLGRAVFGVKHYRDVYNKNISICRCMYEDLLEAYSHCVDENDKPKQLNPNDKRLKANRDKKIKESIEESLIATSEDEVNVDETTVADDDTQIDYSTLEYCTLEEELNILQNDLTSVVEQGNQVNEALTIEESVPQIEETDLVADEIDDEVKLSFEQYFAPILGITNEEIENAGKVLANDTVEKPVNDNLFERLSNNVFALNDMCYICNMEFDVMHNGMSDCDKGESILIYNINNGKKQPYLMEVEQFNRFVASGKYDYWFRQTFPRNMWRG